ncbi:MAG TPA: hypothetical protein VH349_09375 [Ktedonobacterales bacterium]
MTLIATTENAQVDALLREIVARFEEAFPERVRGYFVIGSYGDASSVSTSDLDLDITFKRRFESDDERERVRDLCAALQAQTVIELDLDVGDEESLRGGLSPNLKLAGLCVYGEDVRDQYPLLPVVAWTRDRMHSSYYRLGSLFGRTAPVRAPLIFPDPTGEFFGYDGRLVRLADGSLAPSTRDLIRATGWAATALIALRAGRYVARKSECHRMYEELIGDEWAPLLTAIYENCRQRWNYRIPTKPADRALLRRLCARTLDFENAFLAAYKIYLLGELRSADAAGRRFVRETLERMPFVDAEVMRALTASDSSSDSDD